MGKLEATINKIETFIDKPYLTYGKRSKEMSLKALLQSMALIPSSIINYRLN